MNQNLAAFVSLSLAACTAPVDDAEPLPLQQPEKEMQILYGEEMEQYDVPSIAAVTKGGSSCTATMIHPQMALTAAHCVAKPYYMKLIYGASDVNPIIDEDEKELVHEVAETVKHHDYGRKKFQLGTHDLGLIILEQPIEGVKISPIATPEMQEETMQVGEFVQICGYGKDENRESKVLRCAEVPVTYRTSLEVMVGFNFSVPVEGACFGDSGGPLFQSYHEEEYVAGVASRLAPFTKGCGQGAIYVQPGCYQPWIRDNCETYLDPESCTGFAEETGCDFDDYIKIKTEAIGPGCSYSGKSSDGLIPLLMISLWYGLRRRKE